MASRYRGKDVHSTLKYLWPGVSAYFSLESFFSVPCWEARQPWAPSGAEARMALPSGLQGLSILWPTGEGTALPQGSAPELRPPKLSQGRLCSGDKNQPLPSKQTLVSSVQFEKSRPLYQAFPDTHLDPWAFLGR